MPSVYADLLYTGRRVVTGAFLNFKGASVTSVSKRPVAPVVGTHPVVTPAFIDPHSHIGMVRAGEPDREADGNDEMGTMMVVSDALDALQMDDAALRDAVEMGILYSCIMPGSGNIIGGRTAVIRHVARHSSEALVARAGIKAAFGYNPTATSNWKGDRPTTRMGAFGMLRERLADVRQKLDESRTASGRKRSTRRLSPADAVLQALIEKKERLRAHVHKIDDIAALLRLADAFGLDITVEHAMDVHTPEIFSELKQRGIPIVYGPVDAFAYKVELKHENWRNLRHLLASGVTFGLMTDHPVVPARNLLLQTRWFLRLGWTRQAAVELVTRRNAEILGLGNLLGTLARGRWASFVCWNGDPFDLASHPTAVYGEGQRLYPDGNPTIDTDSDA